MIVRSLLDIQTILDATNVILKPKQVFHHLTTLMHPCAIHAILVQVFFGLLLNNFRFLPSIFVSIKKSNKHKSGSQYIYSHQNLNSSTFLLIICFLSISDHFNKKRPVEYDDLKYSRKETKYQMKELCIYM